MELLKPRISVVVPCYNYGHLLHETLENLLLQTFSNWECIIVDDGSTDNTAEVARKVVEKDPRFKYVYQANSGLSAARNTGISKSDGEFIQLLDADDLLKKMKFERELSLFDENPNIEIVYSEVRYFHSNEPQTLRYSMFGENKPWMSMVDSANQQLLKETLIKVNIAAVNCFLIKKSVFNTIGQFNTQLKSVEDWEFWCRCAFKNVVFKSHSDEDSFALVRLHDNSMSRSPKGMMGAATIARLTINNLIEEDLTLEGQQSLLKENLNELAFLHKSLYELFKEEGDKAQATYHLIKYASIKKEYKYLLRERLKLLLNA